MSMLIKEFRIDSMDDFLDEIDDSTEFFIDNSGKKVECVSVEALARLLNNYVEFSIKDVENE